MDVDDTSVFLSYIEPNIEDIDKVHNFLDKDNIEYLELSKLMDYIKDDSKKIIEYSNQDFIDNYLEDNSLDNKSYEAIKYLVSNESVKDLPQYGKAIQSLDSLLDFFKERKNKVSERIDALTYSYMDKYISKKYYDMFNNNDVFILDPMEFINFINRLEIEETVKVKIIDKAIRCNINHYYENDVNEVIKPFKSYLSNKYVSLIDNVSKYYDLSLDIDELQEQTGYDRENIITLKKIWLVNKIKGNKNNKELVNELTTLVKQEE